MTYEEIKELLKYDEKSSKLYMPNEIFDDLKNNIKKAPHIAFGYSYVFLITWLYRNCKYFNVDELLNNDKLKEILGYDPKQQTLNYLIKRNGLLDEIGYTKTVRDYPVSWEYDPYSDKGLTFELHSDIHKDFHDYFKKPPKGFFLKEPVKALNQKVIDENGKEYEAEGTFHNVSNTHMIPFEVFLYCMNKEKELLDIKKKKEKEKGKKDGMPTFIGCIGFYLYCYLRHKSDLIKLQKGEDESYCVPLSKLSEDTGIPIATLNRYMSLLKSYKMIDFEHNMDYFVPGIADHLRKGNSYEVRDFDLFHEKPAPYKRIKKMDYDVFIAMMDKKREEEADIIAPGKVSIDESELPF